MAKANICHHEEEVEKKCSNRLCLLRIVPIAFFFLICLYRLLKESGQLIKISYMNYEFLE